MIDFAVIVQSDSNESSSVFLIVYLVSPWLPIMGSTVDSGFKQNPRVLTTTLG